MLRRLPSCYDSTNGLVLVPGGGIEPPRAEARRILSPLRLPVPPSRLGFRAGEKLSLIERVPLCNLRPHPIVAQLLCRPRKKRLRPPGTNYHEGALTTTIPFV